jgi:hypothetical protein
MTSALHIGYREAKGHAILFACVGGLSVLSFGLLGAGDRSIFGPLKWNDFVHFYTLGQIARTGPPSLLYDADAQYIRQVELVPASVGRGFLPIYGPQTALLFAPLSLLPYLLAGWLWATITIAIYLWAVWIASRKARSVFYDEAFVIAAALAFPPVWLLPMYGQTTIVPLFAFAAGWLALEAERPFAAGLALGLLAVKPQLGLVLAPVAFVAAEWRLIGGVLVSVGVQFTAALAWFGPSVFPDYLRALRRLPISTALLEPDAYKMHSITALTKLLPGHANFVTWAGLSLLIVIATASIWRHSRSPRVRFGVLVLGSVLVSPHTAIYDVTVVALPVIWLGGWLLEQNLDATWFWQSVYWLAVALFLPTALLIKVQLSVVIMAVMFVRVALRCWTGGATLRQTEAL